jgi:probable F420-dependent oxidoreductase
MARPFRFGVQVSKASSATEWRDKARKYEDLGFSVLTMPDHFDQELSPIAAVAAAAAHTTTLRVGWLVIDNDYRHPAVLAKEAATIDLLSDGRLEFGIGAGWMRADYDWLGLPYDPPAVRVDRFEEAIGIMKACLRGQSLTYHGEHYRITDYTGLPRPVQQPYPPFLIGGGGKRVLSIAGREADIVGINLNLRAGELTTDMARDASHEQTTRKVEWVRDAAGDRFADIEIQVRYFLINVTNDRNGFAEAVARGFGVSAEEILTSGTVLCGTVDEIIETLQRNREEWGVSYVAVGDDNVDAIAPVVAKLTGT